MSTFHTIVKTKSKDHTEDDPNFDYKVICKNPDQKCGWSECVEPHTVDGKYVDPYDCDEGDPWAGCDDKWEFHGVVHTYYSEYDWTVPHDGCCVEDHPELREEARELLADKPEGSYPVIDEWDDTEIYLSFAPDEASR